MASSLAHRIFLAHLELSYRLGRKVTLTELGEMIAREMGREASFTAAAVSRWEKGTQMPSLQIIEAIASLTGMDPGWLSHGEKSAAPGPRIVQDVSAPSLQRRPLVRDVELPGRAQGAKQVPEQVERRRRPT
jgi:transcriptional regulator with XRE-family HTH domain